MNEVINSPTSRREFIKDTGRFAAVSVLAGVAIPHVHAAGSSTVQVALVGCGGGGGGAASKGASTQSGPVTLDAVGAGFGNKIKEPQFDFEKQTRDVGG